MQPKLTKAQRQERHRLRQALAAQRKSLKVPTSLTRCWSLRVRKKDCPKLSVWCEYFIAKHIYEELQPEDLEKINTLVQVIDEAPEGLSGFLPILEMLINGNWAAVAFLGFDVVHPRVYFGLKGLNIETRYFVNKPTLALGPNPARKRGFRDNTSTAKAHQRNVDRDWTRLFRCLREFDYLTERLPSLTRGIRVLKKISAEGSGTVSAFPEDSS
jgi:hypothetical protein